MGGGGVRVSAGGLKRFFGGKGRALGSSLVICKVSGWVGDSHAFCYFMECVGDMEVLLME